MHRRVDVARTYTRSVAARLRRRRGARSSRRCTPRRTAVEAASYVCDQAVQLHGGTGYMHGTEVERHYRDARILGIGGGATEVLDDLTAKLLGYARMTDPSLCNDTPPRPAAEVTGRRAAMLEKIAALDAEHAKAVAGGGEKYVDRHHAPRQAAGPRAHRAARSTRARRSSSCPRSPAGARDFTVGASVVTGIGVVEGVECMVIANDPTVRGGASNPWTVKKLFRAAQIARENRLPTVNLVESGGADLPTQKEIFIPGGALFRGLTRGQRRPHARRSRWCSATAPPAAPTCPGMSDYVVMVKEQAKVFLGGPPLVKMATGEESDDESLGGAEMHARTSGLADYLAVDERDAIRIGRRIVARLNHRKAGLERRPLHARPTGLRRAGRGRRGAARPDPDRPQGAVRPARGDRPAMCDGAGPGQRGRVRRVQAALRALAGDRLGAAARPPDRHPRQRAGRAVLRRRPRRPRSSSSSPTRSTYPCCSCTTPPATWSARSTSRAASSSTAR